MSELRIERMLAAPPERVWRALTDPRALAAWFWPPAFGTRAEADPRPGGTLRIEAPGRLAVSGEYTLVEPPHRLAFTWRWDGDPLRTVVTVELSTMDGATRLTLTHAGFPDEAGRDDHATGWSDCLGRLPAYLG